MKNLGRIIAMLAVLLTLMAGGYAHGASSGAANFFKGKVVECIVPYKTGGGYDAWVRTIAPYFKKYSGASLVVKNVPGAGSLVGTNKMFISDPTGLTIGIVNGVGVMQAQLTGVKGVRYDLAKFTWLARLTAEQRVMYMGMKSKYKTIFEMMKATTPIKIGAPGLGSSNFYEVVLIAEAIGMPVDMITGYETANEVVIAVIRGELEGASGSYSSVIGPLQNRDTVAVAQYGDLKMPFLNEVPHINTLPVKGKEGKELMDVVIALNDMGRAIVAPPGVPAERTKFLEDVLKKCLDDPDFLKIADKQQMEVVYLSGAKAKQIVQKGLAISPALKQKLKDVAGKYQQ